MWYVIQDLFSYLFYLFKYYIVTVLSTGWLYNSSLVGALPFTVCTYNKDKDIHSFKGSWNKG